MENLPAKKSYEIEIESARDVFLQIADEKTYMREAAFAMQVMSNNTALQICSHGSIRNAVANIALTGASLNPILQQAFLIPRKGKCCLDFSYRGLVKLAVDSGSVLDMDATVVHEKDEFYYEQGLNPILKHIPCLEESSGEMTHVYAIATLLSGIKKFIVLSRAEVEKIRKVSQMPNGTMWKDFYDEGCRKTAIKKLYKLLPQTDKLSHAVWVVNEHEGIDFEAKESTAAKLMAKIENKGAEPQTETTAETAEEAEVKPKHLTVEELVAKMESSKNIFELKARKKKYIEDYNALTGEEQVKIKIAADRRKIELQGTEGI